ncbi:MAG: HTH-type transcriptional regulator MtrR [Candidatus Marinimicrobia bacterium]|nr:HTH-type transcriptional regulator MtrR [Candidatus Neomarinimicrobiota bacterium]
MTPKQVDKEARRRQIFQAAMELYSQKGVARTTIQEIAEQAGIGKGTVYEYFDRKEDILAYMFDSIQEESEAIIAEQLTPSMNAEKKLVAYITGIMSFFDRYPADITEILLVFWAEGILNSPRNPADASTQSFDLRSMYEEYNQIVAQILDEGKQDGLFRQSLDSEAIAPAIIGALDGLMLQWVLLKDQIDFHDGVNNLLTVVLDGIREHEGND